MRKCLLQQTNVLLTELELKQRCLLHDPEELLLIYLTITIPVCLINHFLQQRPPHTSVKQPLQQEAMIANMHPEAEFLPATPRLSCSRQALWPPA